MRDIPLTASDTVVARRNDLVEAEINDEILALSIEHGVCYGMNSVASHIWKLLAKPTRICDLCTTLLAAYRVDPGACERQVLDLLEELRTEGLLVAVEEK
jgi:Coenzyme PQQ synthesis protein D (PqqD)